MTHDITQNVSAKKPKNTNNNTPQNSGQKIIRSRLNNDILFEGAFDTMTSCLEAALYDNAPLAYADLRHLNLSTINLDDANLQHVDFSHSNLTGANLSDSTLL